MHVAARVLKIIESVLSRGKIRTKCPVHRSITHGPRLLLRQKKREESHILVAISKLIAAYPYGENTSLDPALASDSILSDDHVVGSRWRTRGGVNSPF